jgi:protein tyrosine phosphatase (PTP) superfamily phosphohydrolase (DUF442 family)
LLSEINNFVQLTERISTSGQPAAGQFASIREAGAQSVINLATPDSKGAIPNEGEIVTRLGMSYVQIPVVWASPTRADFDLFSGVLFANRERRVHVHCVVNHRVSAFMFLYRSIHAGDEPSSAKADMERIWSPNPTWAEFLDEILSAHDIDYYTL